MKALIEISTDKVKIPGKFIFTTLLSASLLLAGCAYLPEGRAVWVIRHRLAEPEAAASIIRVAKNNNLNTLFVQVHGRGDAYYNSEIEPRAETLSELPPDYDPLKELVKMGRAAELEIHAWVNLYYAWNRPPPMPVSPRHLVNLQPDYLLTDDEGRRIDSYDREEMARSWVEGLYLDPARKEVRSHLVEVCMEIASKYPVHGIHLDYVRFPGSSFGFSERLRNIFYARHGVDPLLITEKVRNLQSDPAIWLTGKAPLADRWNHYYYALWNAEKARAISETVRQIYRNVKRIRPETVLSAAVIPDPDRAYYNFSQDWRRWLREGYLDMVLPMAYYGDINRVRSQVTAAAAAAGRDKVYAGLGAWIKEPRAISREIDMLNREGIKGFSLFSYKSIAEKTSYLRGLIPMRPRWAKSKPPPVPVVEKTFGRKGIPFWLDRHHDWNTEPWEEASKIDRPVTIDIPRNSSERAILETAVAAGFRAGDREVHEYLEALAGEFYSYQEFDRTLERLDLSPPELKKIVEQEIILYKYITARLYTAAIPKPDEKAWVAASADISYILRVVHYRDGEERRQAAKKLMEDILYDLDTGGDFTALAGEYSQGSTAKQGGRAGTVYYSPGDETSEAIFALDEGWHSSIIEGYSGYYIYKVNAFHSPYMAEYQSLPWKLKRHPFQERLKKSIENLTAEKPSQ